jgi:hypothetical protein
MFRPPHDGAGDRTGRQQAPVALTLEIGQRGAKAAEDAEQVDIHQPHPLFVAKGLALDSASDASIRNHDVEAAVMILCGGKKLVDLTEFETSVSTANARPPAASIASTTTATGCGS